MVVDLILNKVQYVSPVEERGNDNAYGYISNKISLSEKKDLTKLKRKFLQNGPHSNRKSKVKSKQTNYRPISGKIDLVSRNKVNTPQVKNENSKY